MDFDEFVAFLAKTDTNLHQIGMNIIARIEKDTNFVEHKEEILAEMKDVPKGTSALKKSTLLADAYKTVMRRHGLPETLAADSPKPEPPKTE